jgi:hypothetical protein
MSTEATLIDEIVSRVLRELRSAEGSAPSPTASPASVAVTPPASKAESSPAPTNRVTVLGAIVTGELLEKSIGGAKIVHVTPKAILTPSARDVVRHRGLEIVRESKASAKPEAPGWRILVSSAGAPVDAALDALRSAGIGFDRQLTGTSDEGVTLATSALSRGEVPGIVLLTQAPEMAACLANRSDKIRAVPLRDVATLSEIRKQFAPNLLAVDPTKKSGFELRQLLKAILTS